jgi:Kef-type K+ transport system membrane component KefB
LDCFSPLSLSSCPLFTKLKLSPVLGFLGTGLLLNRAGLFIENQEVDQFCELGIQFLLFEMGLELSAKRLQSLAKYAFGLGLTQGALCEPRLCRRAASGGRSVRYQGFGVSFSQGNDDMLQVSSILEAVVIGFALLLSSSAFGLQLLADRNMLTTKFGTASLGVLLFQDLGRRALYYFVARVASCARRR